MARNAWSIAVGISPTVIARPAHLVSALKTPHRPLVSWSVPRALSSECRWTFALMVRIGDESKYAVATPVVAFNAPGPLIVTSTPGFPVTRA